MYGPGEAPTEYPNGWVPIKLSYEVKPNCLIGAQAFGKDLAVFRDSEGKLHVLDAYCPFNGWTFNEDGDFTRDHRLDGLFKLEE